MEQKENKKDEFIRALLHFPVGLMAILIMAYVKPLLVGVSIGCLGGFSFLVYEAMNDWRKEDWSYKDVIGFVAGIYFGGFLIWLVNIIT